MAFDTSSFLQWCLVGLCAFTAILTYQALYEPKGSEYFDEAKTRESSIFIVTILIIFFIQFKSCTDNKIADAQQTAYNDTLIMMRRNYHHKIDSISTAFIDKLKRSTNDTTGILARYGFNLDSLHNTSINDTSQNGLNNSYGETSKLTLYADSTVKYEGYINNVHKFSIGFVATGSYCTGFNINVEVVYVWNGQYIKVSGKQQLLRATDIISTTPVYTPLSLANAPSDVSRFFFYISGTYNNKEPFESVITYDAVTNSSGPAAPQITSEILHLIKD